MRVQLRFFATFREAVGRKELEREYSSEATVGDVLDALAAEFSELAFTDETGDLREHLSIMRNGRDIAFLEGLETAITDGDTISIFPPVAGGAPPEVVRTFRGISRRAAMHYLERVGGERIDETHARGDGWRATVDTAEVDVGPSLQLTEVTVRFTRNTGTIQPVVDAFARKAMRVGG